MCSSDFLSNGRERESNALAKAMVQGKANLLASLLSRLCSTRWTEGHTLAITFSQLQVSFLVVTDNPIDVFEVWHFSCHRNDRSRFHQASTPDTYFEVIDSGHYRHFRCFIKREKRVVIS